GGYHTCAFSDGSPVRCWGSNAGGQLGNNSTTDSPFAVPVSNLGGEVTTVAAGAGHTCALTLNGDVYCWGSNAHGKLGDNSTTNRSVPVLVSGLTGVKAIAAGGDHTCALTNAGGVVCWGYNNWGQLGNGSTVDSSVPVPVFGFDSGVIAIGTGDVHSC